MMNQHPITNINEAERYIERLTAFNAYLGAYAKRAQKQAEAGILLPRFVYQNLIETCENILTGAPFTTDGQSPLYAAFATKVDALDIDAEKKDSLKQAAQRALLDYVEPSYRNLISMFSLQELLTDDQDGVWKLPRGDEYYKSRLKHFTTTDMSADEIHDLGLKDVARIHDDMRAIMSTIGFDGTLQEFFAHLRSDPKFTYSNDQAGRTRYINEATSYIDDMRNNLGTLFTTQPS